MFGDFLRQYRQTERLAAAQVELLQGAPPETLVAHRPIYLRGALPAAAGRPEARRRPPATCWRWTG